MQCFTDCVILNPPTHPLFIVYGQVMMMLKIYTFYFSTTMSQNVWIAVDVFITVFLTWAVSQSKAAKRLAPERPTARLLGPQTLASCWGLVAINWLFLIGAFVMLYKQSKLDYYYTIHSLS